MSEELTLEKLKIDERLRGVELAVTTLTTVMKERMVRSDQTHTNLEKLAAHHDRVIFGNGSNSGIKLQIDRLESFPKQLKNHTDMDRWMFTTVIGLLLFILGKLFLQ